MDMAASTSPVHQVHSDLDFYRYILPNVRFLGMHIPRITPDKEAPPKIVVAKLCYHRSRISTRLDEPFRQYALRFNNPDPPTPERHPVVFVNVEARRVAGLYRLWNDRRIPTIMIIRNGIILVERLVSSERELELLMTRHMESILELPGNAPYFPTLFQDYSHIVQFYQYRGPILRAIFAFSCVWNSVLHLFGRCIPDVEKFPNGLIGTIMKMLCQLVDVILYINNNSIDTSRFLDIECPPVSVIHNRGR